MKKLFTKSLFAFMLLSASFVLNAQVVNQDRYVTISVVKGKEIRFRQIKAEAENTKVKIQNGAQSSEFLVGEAGVGPKSFVAEGNTIVIYGNVVSLDCSENANNLTAVDVTKNTQLRELFCQKNSLTKLDLSKNKNLNLLNCGRNQLKELNVKANTKLIYFYCDSNKISSLDLTKNTELVEFACFFNSLKSLNVTKNSKLQLLDCSANNLTSLDVSGNPMLHRLVCAANNFTAKSLDSIYCALPDRKGMGAAGQILPIYEPASENYAAVLASSAKNAINKNWKVSYLNTGLEFPETKGKHLCGNTTDVETLKQVSVTLYPNPVVDFLYVQSQLAVLSLDVFDMNGARVAKSLGADKINLSHLSAGSYTVRLQTVNGSVSYRIVKR